MHTISYLFDPSILQPSQLTGFFVGWPQPPSTETLLNILNASTHVAFAIDVDTNQVVGFITCLSDGILAAYIPLLEVLPEYQRHGIGKQLLDTLLDRINLYMIDVVCDADLLPFYEKLGFRAGTSAMRRDYARQSGDQK